MLYQFWQVKIYQWRHRSMHTNFTTGQVTNNLGLLMFQPSSFFWNENGKVEQVEKGINSAYF